ESYAWARKVTAAKPIILNIPCFKYGYACFGHEPSLQSIMTNLSIALLVASLAFGANTWGQNSTKDSRQPPTIEDRIGQLEQRQDDLSGQVDALNQKVTSLQQEIKFLKQKPGESTDNISQTPARPSGATAESSSDGT